MSPLEGDPRCLFHVNNIPINLPLEALNHRGNGRLNHLQGKRGPGARSSPASKWEKVEILSPHIQQLALPSTALFRKKPLWLELERVVPALRVPPNGPDIDEQPRFLGDVVASDGAVLGRLSEY